MAWAGTVLLPQLLPSPEVRTDIDIRAGLAVLRPKESREIHRVVPGV